MLVVGHLGHLVCDALDPCLVGFDVGDHYGELLSDYRLVDESLSEYLTLVSPLEALFCDGARPSCNHAGHHEAFVVEVCHDDLEAFVLWAEEVAFGDFDVVEFDVGCSGGFGVGGSDGFEVDVVVFLYEEHGVAFVGFASCYEVVGEDAIGDPAVMSVCVQFLERAFISTISSCH